MNINVTSLDKPCENKLLIKIGGLLPNWLQYAHMLGLSEQDINGIRTDPFLSNDWLKSQKVLEKWRNANPGQICLDLVKVCLELQHGRTAMEICQKGAYLVKHHLVKCIILAFSHAYKSTLCY